MNKFVADISSYWEPQILVLEKPIAVTVEFNSLRKVGWAKVYRKSNSILAELSIDEDAPMRVNGLGWNQTNAEPKNLFTISVKG